MEGKKMNSLIPAILTMAAPLLFATLGALVSEYAGVLAVFMDGAITLAAFACIAVTSVTGSALAGFFAAVGATVFLLYLIARFNEATGANPFITGLSVNLLANGLTSWLSSLLFGTRGVIALSSSVTLIAFPRGTAAIAALAATLVLAFILNFTRFGLNLRITGSAPDVLASRGISASKYRIFSWCIAAFFAACAGTELALSLGAWVPNISAGRGWTALAAVYLGYKNPLLCLLAVVLFAAAEYSTNVIQGTGYLPATAILGIPYILALLAFILIPVLKKRKI